MINDYAKLSDDIARWIADYCVKNGREALIVGLSGGVDSAVVAKLCQKAVRLVRNEQVQALQFICVAMPYSVWSDAESFRKAKLLRNDLPLASFFGYQINSIVDAYKRCSSVSLSVAPIELNYSSNIALSKLREGNLRARIRANILYDIAGGHNGLVVGTGNLDEEVIGYCTKGGDGLADILPLGGCHKSEVYNLAHTLGVLQEIITAAPSAGLWEGQTDQGELGLSYDEIAWAIETLAGREWPAISEDDGYCTLVLQRVQELMMANLHKSKMPPLFDIGHPTIADIESTVRQTAV